MSTHSEQASVSSADLSWSQDIMTVKCNQPLSVFSLLPGIVMVALVVSPSWCSTFIVGLGARGLCCNIASPEMCLKIVRVFARLHPFTDERKALNVFLCSELLLLLHAAIPTMKSGSSVEALCCADIQLNLGNLDPSVEHNALWISESSCYYNGVVDKALMCSVRVPLSFFPLRLSVLA